MKRTLPTFATDEEAERFVDTADLSEYDLSGFRPARIVFEPSEPRVDVPVSAALLRKVMAKAKREGTTYERFVVDVLENAVRNPRAG